MKSSYYIIFIFLIVIIYGVFKKVNVYDSFINGAKEGIVSVINMFSFILTFMIAINLLNSSGIIDYFINKLNIKFIDLLIQMIVRPFSSSSSLSIMTSIYEKHGVDSIYGVLSTFIHSVSDTTFYIITFYYGSIGIKPNGKLILSGILVNVIGNVLLIVVIYFLL